MSYPIKHVAQAETWLLGLLGGQQIPEVGQASCGQSRDTDNRQNGQMAFLDSQQGSLEPLWLETWFWARQ